MYHYARIPVDSARVQAHNKQIPSHPPKILQSTSLTHLFDVYKRISTGFLCDRTLMKVSDVMCVSYPAEKEKSDEIVVRFE